MGDLAGPLKSAELETTTLTGARFTLEQAPTTTTKGTRWTVGFGAASLETVPVLPSHVVSKATRVFIGGIQLEHHGQPPETRHREQLQGIRPSSTRREPAS